MMVMMMTMMMMMMVMMMMMMTMTGFPPQVSSPWYVRALGGFGLSTSGE